MAWISSDDSEDQRRAIESPLRPDVCRDVVRVHPELTTALVLNKTVPLEILEELATHADEPVRAAVAMKRKLSHAAFERLAGDTSERVKLRVANNAKVPTDVLVRLTRDSNELVARTASERLISRR